MDTSNVFASNGTKGAQRIEINKILIEYLSKHPHLIDEMDLPGATSDQVESLRQFLRELVNNKKEDEEPAVLGSTTSILQTSEFLGKPFTVLGTPSDPLFIAKEVAELIDYAKTGNGKYDVSSMLKTVDDDEKGTNIVRTLGGSQEMLTLTEYGLYEVLMQSRKPIAKQFKKGVKQLLKSIRTTGVACAVTDFRGVPAVISGDRIGYYMRDVLDVLGYSRTSGSASGYKKRYPSEFFKLAGRNYCSPRMAEMIGRRADLIALEAKMAQELNFSQEGGQL